MRPVAPGACCEGLACLGGEDKCVAQACRNTTRRAKARIKAGRRQGI